MTKPRLETVINLFAAAYVADQKMMGDAPEIDDDLLTEMRCNRMDLVDKLIKLGLDSMIDLRAIRSGEGRLTIKEENAAYDEGLRQARAEQDYNARAFLDDDKQNWYDNGYIGGLIDRRNRERG